MACCDECDDLGVAKGDQGDQGVAGPQGLFGGFSSEWAFSTAVGGSPAATVLRFDNAAYAGVTQIVVSDTNKDSVNVDAFLDSLDNDGQFGYVRVFAESDSSKFWSGRITAVVDNGADHTLTVTYILHNGAFLDSQDVVLTFAPTGPEPVPPPDPRSIHISFKQSAAAFKEIPVAANNEMGDIVWPGSTFYGDTVTAIRVIAEQGNAGTEVILYDETNALVLASVPITAGKAIYSLLIGAFVGTPSLTQAIWQIRTTNPAGPVNGKLYAVVVEI